jgi:hypothetical protein
MLALIALAACGGGPKVRVDQDSHANFASYKTFSWMEHKPSDADPAKIATLSGQRVRASLETALKAKGLTLDESKPDVRVSYVFNVYQRPKQGGMRIGIGAGGGSGNVAGGVGMSVPVGPNTESVGAMTIDIIDIARNSQVWTGSFESHVSSKGPTDEDVQKLVDKILAKYPVNAAK